jgi:regulator of protease activity HflC (stomatin/prohibitin superfamily)
VKDVELNQSMVRAMARQAEGERERRAKVIHAEGEFQASAQLAAAAKKMGEEPGAMTLRFLQTLVEIGVENNTTTIFPVPIDLFENFLTKGPKISQDGGKD